jgi:high-affinity iron transporter
MLPTFVIGLREGVEASLIVGIVAAFLRQRGAGREMWWVWSGVALAVAVCAATAVGLEILDENLPQREQERLETVIALIAVAMVTSMIVWMARQARGIKGDLESAAAGSALAEGSMWALVGMAFLAVLREGLETAVFLLSAFQASTDRGAAASGAVLGIGVAIVIGWLIYRGGMRINLTRFFTVTGLVLVLVAAGLVAFAAHTAHEAGWLDVAQGQLVDLSGVIVPGSAVSALVTGVLGVQPKPTVAEGIGWLVYFAPVAAFVIISSRRRPSRRPASAVAATSS